MKPINWKSISAPSIDINSKSENKVDEKNKGFNTYRKDPKVESNSSTSKLNNQSVLIKQASAHVTQNSGSNINHIKNSTLSVRLDQNTSDTSKTGKANQTSFTKHPSPIITQNNSSSVFNKKVSQGDNNLPKEILVKLNTVKSATHAIDQTISSQIDTKKFHNIAEAMLIKSTISHSINDLQNFKSDLKTHQPYLTKDLYSEIKNSLDTQLKIEMNKVKIENLMKAVKAYNDEINIFNADATINNKALKPHINLVETIPTAKFEIIARNILNKSTLPISEKDQEKFRSQIKAIKSSIPPEIYSQFKKYLDN